MKKTIALALALLLCFSVFAQGASESKSETAALKVGMVTDSGTIDDRSFNQGTFEGVKKAAEEFGLECTYLRPSGTTTTDYVTAITDLYDAGYRFIACPGFLFADAVAQVQAMYDDLMLVIIDDALSAGIGANSVAVVFKEHESGFLAGLATALKLEEGSVGFLGGMEIPSVQKFNWGFQQGVIYANENYGTKITMDPSNFVYSGSFADIALGQQIANTLFSKGVDVVFCAAGTTGVGGLNE
ncbi:MAG: BMP family protein, partial [Candidatus Ornithospirochaeta sp.]